ncbi:MAG: hypothetical protein WEA09_04090 [Gemmatimonadota bacterium]
MDRSNDSTFFHGPQVNADFQPSSDPVPTVGVEGFSTRPRDEVSLVEVLILVLRYRNIFYALMLVSLTGFMVHGLLQPRMYTATAHFIPQGADGASGGAVAVAQRLGFDLGGGAPGQGPGFFTGVLLSREALFSASQAEFTLPTEEGPVTGTLGELFDLEFGDVYEELFEGIKVAEGWEPGVIRLTVDARAPEVAEQLVTHLLEFLNEFNTATRRTQASEEVRFAEERLAQVRAELREAEEELQLFLQQNRQYQNSPELGFVYDRLLREVQLKNSVVNQLALSYESARIDQVRNTPVISVLEGAAGSALPKSRRFPLRIVGSLLLGVAVAFLLSLLLELGRRLQNPERGVAAEEFRRLRREAWSEIRHPATFLPGRRASGG